MKRGHVPIRTCVGCRKRRPAQEMVRLKAANDTVVVATDDEGIPGRGCYVCPEEKCLEAALRKGCLSRALRTKIVDPPSKEGLLRGLEKMR